MTHRIYQSSSLLSGHQAHPRWARLSHLIPTAPMRREDLETIRKLYFSSFSKLSPYGCLWIWGFSILLTFRIPLSILVFSCLFPSHGDGFRTWRQMSGGSRFRETHAVPSGPHGRLDSSDPLRSVIAPCDAGGGTDRQFRRRVPRLRPARRRLTPAGRSAR